MSINSSSVYYLGTGTSFDVSNIPGYQNLTKDNFIVCACSSFVVTAQTNASESIGITAAMEAPYNGYYKIGNCSSDMWDQNYMNVSLNTDSYTYVSKGQVIGVRFFKSSGVKGRFTAELLYKVTN